jgi:hypothetical protein
MLEALYQEIQYTQLTVTGYVRLSLRGEAEAQLYFHYPMHYFNGVNRGNFTFTYT